MLKIKRTASLVLLLALLVGLLVGCVDSNEDNGKIKIVCSVFPEYDWVRNIVGDSENVEVSLLVSGGQELHSYEATPADIVKLKQSDIVISVGGVSDAWVSKALSDEDVNHIKLTQIEGVVLREVTDHSGDHTGHDHGHKEVDEHIWLSLKNAEIIVKKLCKEISALDEINAEKYNNNTKNYIEHLKVLDKRMSDIATDEHTLLFADRFPFVYFLEDYSIPFYAAFEGCSSDIGWTPKTTLELADRLDASSKKYLFVTETSDGELARTVISTSKNGGETVSLNSMQSVAKADVPTASYLEIMSQNVSVIERVLGN